MGVCVCIECYVKPFQRDRFDSWLHFSLAHKEYKQTQIMVSTLDSITSLCWCYMLFSRSIFAHFVFMHTNICIFVVFSSLSLLLSFNCFCFGSIYRHLGIGVYGYVCEWCVCVRAFLSISFKFSHCFLVCFWMNGREANTLRSPITWFSFFLCVCGCMLAYFLGMAAVDDFDHAY